LCSARGDAKLERVSSNTTSLDFSSLRVSVVGDIIADHYLVTQPRSLSREAPVMVLRYKSEDFQAGGAANVARNVRALGAATRLHGAVGRDQRGRELIELLEGFRIDTLGVETLPEWTTPTKTRIVAAEPRRSLQQVLRVDREPAQAADPEVRAKIRERVVSLAPAIDVLLISDYDYGMVDTELGKLASELAARGVVVVLDPRSHIGGFEGVTAMTPNVGELARFTGRDVDELADIKDVSKAAGELLARCPMRWLLVTRGNKGMALFGEGCPEKGVAVDASGTGDVTDVTGAGDTAAAVFALALAAGFDAPRSMQIANAASGVVVMEHGAAVCTADQLREELETTPAPVRIG
jgi:rfaE bifunctional protein kinase chain/domain